MILMLNSLFISTLLFAAHPLLTPAEAVAVCIEHQATLPEAQRQQTRYVMSTGADLEGRSRQWIAVNYLLNAVSRSRIIVAAQLIADGRIAVVDLAAYSNQAVPGSYESLFAAWENLVKEQPYWHVRTTVVDGEKKTGTAEVTVDGGWVGIEQALNLRESTGSFGAIMRADFFVARVGAENYYEFAGVGATEAEILKSLGVDEGAINAIIGGTAANLTRSGVTRKPRRVIGYQSLIGQVFVTLDTDRETADANPFHFPVDANGQAFKRVASEGFGLKNNGMWLTWVVDAQGKRADTVPDKIAKDYTGDGIIRSGVSCIRCHELNGGAAALQPFEDKQAKLQRLKGVAAVDPAVAQVLASAYDPARMGKLIARSREDYHAAVEQATGVEPKEAATALAGVFSAYRDDPVTPEIAAYELSLTVETLPEVFAQSRNPDLLLLTIGEPINRGPWESAYQEAALLAEEWRKK